MSSICNYAIRGSQFVFGLIAFSTILGASERQSGFMIWRLEHSFSLVMSTLASVFALFFCFGLFYKFEFDSPRLPLTKILVGVDATFVFFLLMVGIFLEESEVVDLCNSAGHDALQDSFNCKKMKTAISFTFICMFSYIVSAVWTVYTNKDMFLRRCPAARNDAELLDDDEPAPSAPTKV